MKPLKIFLAAAIALFAGSAMAASSNQAMFILDADKPLPTGEQLSKNSWILFRLVARPTTAARLDEGVELEPTTSLGRKRKRVLAAGEVLAGIGSRPGLYCAPVEIGILTGVAPCLEDTDDDGRFDQSRTGSIDASVGEGLATSMKGGIMPVAFGVPSPLPTPIAYRKAAYSDATPHKVNVYWSTTYKPRRATTGPKQVSLWLDAGAGGTIVRTDPITITVGQGDGRVRIGGLTIRVLGFDAKGRLRYLVESFEPGRPALFWHLYIPPTTTIYI